MKLWYAAFLTLALGPVESFAQTSSIASALPFEITEATTENDANYRDPLFPLLPFNKYANNPILTPNPESNFESAYLYNPTAIVLNETIFLFYRAQNSSKTSSIGLAWSTDGTTFTRLDRPIINATEPWEAIGGTEDPRLVRVNGTFYLTYTAFDNVTAQLCLATSTDLLNWTKYPPLFPGFQDVAYSDIDVPTPRVNHTKSGAIIKEPTADGLYHMYFGDSFFYHATSPDLVKWTALPAEEYFAAPVNAWENRLIEPGPAPIKTRDGRWLLVYNGMTTGRIGYARNQYSVGQMLIDPSRSFQPTLTQSQQTQSYQPALRDGPIARLEQPILVPEAGNEQEGQVNQVVFAEGLVQYKNRWYLYFGEASQQTTRIPAKWNRSRR